MDLLRTFFVLVVRHLGLVPGFLSGRTYSTSDQLLSLISPHSLYVSTRLDSKLDANPPSHINLARSALTFVPNHPPFGRLPPSFLSPNTLPSWPLRTRSYL